MPGLQPRDARGRDGRAELVDILVRDAEVDGGAVRCASCRAEARDHGRQDALPRRQRAVRNARGGPWDGPQAPEGVRESVPKRGNLALELVLPGCTLPALPLGLRGQDGQDDRRHQHQDHHDALPRHGSRPVGHRAEDADREPQRAHGERLRAVVGGRQACGAVVVRPVPLPPRGFQGRRRLGDAQRLRFCLPRELHKLPAYVRLDRVRQRRGLVGGPVSDFAPGRALELVPPRAAALRQVEAPQPAVPSEPGRLRSHVPAAETRTHVSVPVPRVHGGLECLLEAPPSLPQAVLEFSLIDRSACPQDAQPVGPALGVHAPRVQPLIYVHRPDLMVGLRGPGAPLHSGLGPLAHDPDDDRPPRPGQAQGGDEESQRHPSGMRLSDERRGTGRGTAPRGLGCPSWQGSSSEPTGAGRAMHSSSAQAPTTAGGAPAVERRGGTLRPTTQRPRAKTMRSGRTKLSRGTQQLVGGLPAFVGLG